MAVKVFEMMAFEIGRGMTLAVKPVLESENQGVKLLAHVGHVTLVHHPRTQFALPADV